jgi:hypothetical protein
MTPRLRVRKGADAPVVVALKQAESQIGKLGAMVRLFAYDGTDVGYEERWADVRKAESAFYDAAAKELRAAEDKSRVTPRILGSR